MKLQEVLEGMSVCRKFHWDPSRSFGKITTDSRTVEPGDLFVACEGTRMDGHDFITQAILAKAGVVVFERLPEFDLPKGIVGIQVKNSKAAYAELLASFYQHPEKKLKLIAVTGTNGKTTTSYLLYQLLSLHTKAAYLGTLCYEFSQYRATAPNTTPSPEVLFPLFYEMVKNRVEYCVMEVSSHALAQLRTYGLHFEVAIFTHLTRDHLDYHHDMESYFQAKRTLFTSEPRPKKALINGDCVYGRRLLEELVRSASFGIKTPSDYQAQDILATFEGSSFIFATRGKKTPFRIKLPLKHNVANVVSALAALDLLGRDVKQYRDFLAEFSGIPGRFERVDQNENFRVFVDYAHTPDAVENILSEAKKLKPKRILTLIGCGGDRDREKRPLMAKAAAENSEYVIFTSDNPRSEDPESILDDMMTGISPENLERKNVLKILNREDAIDRIVQDAQPGDVVFILGKGHEDYQILGDRKIPFDDRVVVKECLKRKTRVLVS